MTTPTLEIAAAVAEVPWSLLSTCSGLRLSHTGARDCPQLRGQIPGNFESRLPTLTLASCVNVGRTSHHLSKPRFRTLAVVIPTSLGSSENYRGDIHPEHMGVSGMGMCPEYLVTFSNFPTTHKVNVIIAFVSRSVAWGSGRSKKSPKFSQLRNRGRI